MTLASKLASARASATSGGATADGVFQRLVAWERDLEGREREAERVRALSQEALEGVEEREQVVKAMEGRVGQREAESLKVKVGLFWHFFAFLEFESRNFDFGVL